MSKISQYEQLHRQCRTLENLFDTKLSSYSQIVATISRRTEDLEASGSGERWKDLEQEAEDLLEKVTGCAIAYMICEATNIIHSSKRRMSN